MSRSYRFGEFRVDASSRELWRGDRLIALPPHVFDCLVYLLERHDRAVGRDELVAAVWGKTEVSDTLLGQTVLRIRRELGDDAKNQAMLRTIPRFGYRWIAALDAPESPDSVARAQPIEGPGQADRDAAPPRAAAPTATIASARRFPGRIALAALATALLCGSAIWMWHRREPAPLRVAPPASADQPGAAVLPAGIEPGAEWAWMRLGVMDIVAARLRSAGMPSVPSEDVVALLRAPEAQRSASLRDAMAVRLLITPRVRHEGAIWQIDLDAEDNAGQHYTATARERDATAAARTATDSLLVALGLRPEAGSTESQPDATLIRRVDAAVLADDPDGARALIAQASAEEQQSPELRLRLAKIDFRGGRFAAARERLVALLDEAPANTVPVLRASVLNGLGAVAIREGNLQRAEQAFGDAITLLQAHAEPEQLGQAYLGRAAAAEEQRHFDAAAGDYARARIAFRQANDMLALIRIAADEGFLDLDQDRPAQALPQFVTAAQGFQQWGALNEAIFAYIGQIGCDLALLDAHGAMQAADAADTLAQHIDNRSTLDSLALARARALAAAGRLRESREALERLRGNDDAQTGAVASAVLARLDLERGNAAAANELAKHAVAVLDTPGNARWRAEAWLTQVRAALSDAGPDRAAVATAALEQWVAKTDDLRAQLFARLARAEYDARFADARSWRGSFDAARELAARNAVPYEVAAVAQGYANALLNAGDIDAAAVEVGRISRWSDRDFDCALLEARLYAALGRNEARQSALARAHALAGERELPAAVQAASISTPKPAN